MEFLMQIDLLRTTAELVSLDVIGRVSVLIHLMDALHLGIFFCRRIKNFQITGKQNHICTVCFGISLDTLPLLSLRFEDGAIGSVVLSELSHGRENSLSFEITGERQSLWWSSDSQNNLYLARKGASLSVLKFEDHFDNTFSRLIQEVYHAIEVNKPSGFPTFAEAQANVRLCEALWQSAENNSCWTEVLR